MLLNVHLSRGVNLNTNSFYYFADEFLCCDIVNITASANTVVVFNLKTKSCAVRLTFSFRPCNLK